MRIFCPAIASSVSLSSTACLWPVLWAPTPAVGCVAPAACRKGRRKPHAALAGPSETRQGRWLALPCWAHAPEGALDHWQGRRCRHWSSPRVKQPVHSARGRAPNPNRCPLPPLPRATRRRHAVRPRPPRCAGARSLPSGPEGERLSRPLGPPGPARSPGGPRVPSTPTRSPQRGPGAPQRPGDSTVGPEPKLGPPRVGQRGTPTD